LLTEGLIVRKLFLKSSKRIGRISSIVIVSRLSPSERKGPMAASFANAVMSEPEKPMQKLATAMYANSCVDSCRTYHQ
jgi:hypothetical protein